MAAAASCLAKAWSMATKLTGGCKISACSSFSALHLAGPVMQLSPNNSNLSRRVCSLGAVREVDSACSAVCVPLWVARQTLGGCGASLYCSERARTKLVLA